MAQSFAFLTVHTIHICGVFIHYHILNPTFHRFIYISHCIIFYIKKNIIMGIPTVRRRHTLHMSFFQQHHLTHLELMALEGPVLQSEGIQAKILFSGYKKLVQSRQSNLILSASFRIGLLIPNKSSREKLWRGIILAEC